MTTRGGRAGRGRIVITSGEPAGIGPDLCLDILNNADFRADIVILGDRPVLAQRAAQLGIALQAADYEKSPTARRSVWHCESQPCRPGQPAPANAPHVLAQLERAVAFCMDGGAGAMVTAPISKKNILASGQAFVGQTEYVAARAGVANPVMLLAGPRLRVALATTHLPLRAVAAALQTESLLATLMTISAALPPLFGIADKPKINVCGLNPHAGEGGYLGDEEGAIIAPAVAAACVRGLNVSGPHSADTILAQSLLPAADCVLAMYHDQALPAIKLLDFYRTINITLGLPFVRVSPDHGIAADLVGRGVANPESMRTAVAFADDIVCGRV